LALLEKGLSLTAVAHRVSATVSSVYRWREAARAGGLEALAPKPVPGRPRKLRRSQMRRLLKILLRGAVAYGFPNEIWTLKRIAGVIRNEFGVEYHPSHVWKLMRAEHWSCQVPERRAVQRDEDAIARWKRQKWPAIKKKGQRTWGPSRFP